MVFSARDTQEEPLDSLIDPHLLSRKHILMALPPHYQRPVPMSLESRASNSFVSFCEKQRDEVSNDERIQSRHV
jgi:hypothetical protein